MQPKANTREQEPVKARRTVCKISFFVESIGDNLLWGCPYSFFESLVRIKEKRLSLCMDKSEIRMKYNINLIVWMVGVVSLFVACTRQAQMTSLLQQTDSLLYRHQSDSALQLLNTISDENSLSGAQRMKFIWNKAMAHYQQEMSLLEDSQLYQSIAYYRRQKIRSGCWTLICWRVCT